MVQILVATRADEVAVFDEMSAIVRTHALPLTLDLALLPKLNDKALLSIKPQLTINKGSPTLVVAHEQTLIKSAPSWQSLTKRIVTAGRKSELILQACKLTAGMSVIDGMAGFGHDGLILASTGAKVLMVEKNPLMALLLLYEHQYMMANPNWQKLLGRIEVRWGDFLEVQAQADVVYLDPMFPPDSYSAKVGKHMQTLHALAAPPDTDEQIKLLAHAKSHAQKVLIKRPLSALPLANHTPDESFANDAVRFDVYKHF